MMAAIIDHSNQYHGAIMEMGGEERISSNLISRLLLSFVSLSHLVSVLGKRA